MGVFKMISPFNFYFFQAESNQCIARISCLPAVGPQFFAAIQVCIEYQLIIHNS